MTFYDRVLQEMDRDLRAAERAAALNDPQARGRLRRAQRRAGRYGDAQRGEASDTVDTLVPKLKQAHLDLVSAGQRANRKPAAANDYLEHFERRSGLTRKLRRALRREGRGQKIGHVITPEGFDDPNEHLRLVAHAIGGHVTRQEGGDRIVNFSVGQASTLRSRDRGSEEPGQRPGQRHARRHNHSLALGQEFMDAGKHHYGDHFKAAEPAIVGGSAHTRVSQISKDWNKKKPTLGPPERLRWLKIAKD